MGCYRFKEVYVLNVFMVFVLEYVIIVFRSLKPRDSNPVSSPTARPDSRAANSITRNVVLVLFAHHVIT